MVIGLLDLEIFLPYSHSLKDKRKRLKSFRDRLQAKHNVAVSELAFQDKWQRTQLGIVTINSKQEIIAKTFQSIIHDAESYIEGEIIRSQIEYF